MDKKKRQPRIRTSQTDVDSAVSDAFSNADELREELQSWYDNLPENFQNGEKGDNLQTAIDQIEGAQAPDVPERIATDTIEYRLAPRRASRSKRLGECCAMLQAAADHAREEADKLDEHKYHKETGKLIHPQLPKHKKDDGDEEAGLPGIPDTADERDNLKTELEAFADECEDTVNDWESVEFPGMYG